MSSPWDAAQQAPPGVPPGWYPDPDGAPGLVRWWNGVSWSDVTTPAGPGVDVGAPLGPPPSAVSTGRLGSDAPARRSPRRTPWVVAGTVLAVLLLALVAVLATGSTETPDPAAGTAAPASPPAGPTFAPGTVRIIDAEAGISYPFLGEGWYEYGLRAPVETTSVAGQYFVTQDDLPDGSGEFIAQITSGPVADGYGWAGAATLRPTVQQLADSVRGNYYPQPAERQVLRDEALTVDGAAAHLFEFSLSWDAEGYDATGERAALLLVDVGRPAPALLYLSIPNTHAELYGVIDRVLADVQLV